MERESTAIRLKKIMSERNLRQVDVLNMVKPYCEKYNIKMNRSDLSQYISGKVIPGQEKLSILGQALNVSETWLMGFDVPLEYETSPVKSNEFTLTDSEKRLISYYRMMNELGKEAAITRIKELTYIPNYMQHSVGPISEISSSTKENTLFAAHEIEGSSKEDKDFDYNIIINGTDW